MGQTRTYDPLQVIVNVDGRDISGFADGTFVTAVRNADAFTLTVGADGENTRAKSNNKSGRFTFTLQQSSPSNAILNEIATQDELSNGGVVPIRVSDKSGTSLSEGEKCWCMKKPDAPFGKETDNREWIFETGNLKHDVGGNALA